MSDIMPKVKSYLFLSVISVIVGIGFTLTKFAYTNTGDIGTLLGGIGTSFVPFASTVLFIFTSITLPPEVLIFIGVLTGIVSGLQLYLIIEIVINHLPLVDI